MKLTVIGHWGGYPAAHGASSGYLLQHMGFNLLIDCGSAVLSNLQEYINIEDLSAVILSHYHYDHIADIGPLKYARLINSKLNKVKETLSIYGHAYDEKELNALNMEPYTRGISYKENEALNLGPFKITFCKTKHPVICYAMRISSEGKDIVYTGDGSYTEELVNFSRNAELLVCECNFYEGENYPSAGHMNSTDAGTAAREAGVKKLLLTHLPHYGDHDELVVSAKKEYKGEVELARVGWTFEI
jgi:ribonuclease BN (tRNA processing enzyme)